MWFFFFKMVMMSVVGELAGVQKLRPRDEKHKRHRQGPRVTKQACPVRREFVPVCLRCDEADGKVVVIFAFFSARSSAAEWSASCKPALRGIAGQPDG